MFSLFAQLYFYYEAFVSGNGIWEYFLCLAQEYVGIVYGGRVVAYHEAFGFGHLGDAGCLASCGVEAGTCTWLVGIVVCRLVIEEVYAFNQRC